MTYVERPASVVARPSLGWVAAGVSLAIALPLAAVLNVWQDEAYTLHTTGGSLAYAFYQAIGFEQNAPLYFLIINLWRHAGDSPFFLRLFSVLCIAASVALVPSLARRYVPSISPVLVTAAVVLNPFMIWAAVEMRVYALVILLSALLMLLFFDAFLSERPRRWVAVAYAVCIAIALYTQYYLAFLVAAQGIVVAFYNRRLLLRYVVAGAVAALAFAPLLVIVPGQVRNFKGAFAAPTLAQSFLDLCGVMLRFVLPLPFSHTKFAYGAILVLVAIAAWAGRRAIGSRGAGAMLVTSAGAFVIFAGLTHALGVHVLDRHAALLFIPSSLGVFALTTYLRAPQRRRAAMVWTCATVVLSVVTLAHDYRALAKPGDWARAAAYVSSHAQGNEPIVVFEAENALPFSYYYRGPNAVVPIPHAVDYRDYDVTRFVVRDPAQLQRVVPRQERVWLVTAGECASANINFGCNVLEHFVANHYDVESDKKLFGSRIRLLVRREGTAAVGKS